MAPKPKHALTEDELAAMAGVSDTTWKSHKVAGCPVPATRAELPTWLKSYHAWRRANGKEHRGGGVGAGSNGALDPEILANKRERGRLQNMAMRIDLAVQQKQLIPVAEVREFASRAILAANARWDAIRMRLASQLGPVCQGGEAFVLAGSDIWHITNNGTDGDDWSRNNVSTGGAGGIGRRMRATDSLVAEVRWIAAEHAALKAL